MKRIQLVHWNADGAKPRLRQMREAGYRVVYHASPAVALQALRERPPDAVVIDLERIPSQGRDVGVALRHRRSTRQIPIVFAGGEPEKVARAREVLPDATYAPWRRIRSALRSALAGTPRDLVVPSSALAAYGGRPLAAKLGIREGMTVALLGAPAGFRGALGTLPEGVHLRSSARGRADLTVWFVPSRAELGRRVSTMVDRAAHGPVWIAWRKRSSGGGDLTQPMVRRIAMDAGLVDYRIASIDADWSALLFTRKRAGKASRGA